MHKLVKTTIEQIQKPLATASAELDKAKEIVEFAASEHAPAHSNASVADLAILKCVSAVVKCAHATLHQTLNALRELANGE